MNKSKTFVYDRNEQALFADGFDDCIIGAVHRFGCPVVALYDRNKVIKKMMAEGSSRDEADEHFEFNIIGGWHGENPPAFAEVIK